ncbi:N-acetyltransferase family protein [Actinotalea sp.]|uniref:GNAT family N-acetyltransferase n=1 Tax=Actinotalea sp. TaxID=1872145 RepID=UPI00356850B8
MSLLVRRAGAGDLAAVTALFTGYLDFYATPAPPERVRAFLSDRLHSGDSVILLGELDGRAVGLAQVFPTLSSLDLATLWTLGDLFVTPEARGAGVGRALLRAVLAEAALAGAATVALETAHDNTRAQGLYESEGFVRDTVYRVYSRPVGD